MCGWWRRIFLLFPVAGIAALHLGPAAAEGVGEERAFDHHLSHAEIVAGKVSPAALLAHGKRLFDARFTTGDGAGRPGATAAERPAKRPGEANLQFLRTSGPDANSCFGCHNQPASGGAGDFTANVFVAPQDVEFAFDSVSADLSMERGTTALHGNGLMELLAREMTAELHERRAAALTEARRSGKPVTVPLTAKGVSFGRLGAAPDGLLDTSRIEGVHPDLVVKPFTQKAVVTSLRQFSINAMNTHHGMQALERFGERYTGEADFDLDGVATELTLGDVTALSLYQATLPPPARVLPADPARRAAAALGEKVLGKALCTACHVPALPLGSTRFSEPGGYNPPGTDSSRDVEPAVLDLAPMLEALERDAAGNVLVPLFSDLKRHVIADLETPHFANEKLTHNFVPRELFRTAPLWGAGSTSPYGHRGDLTTLDEAIRAHGGEAKASRKAYEALPDSERRALIEFLKSLQIGDADGLAALGLAGAAQ